MIIKGLGDFENPPHGISCFISGLGSSGWVFVGVGKGEGGATIRAARRSKIESILEVMDVCAWDKAI